MKDQLAPLIDESIKIELYMAELYRVFSEIFAEDAEFWGKLHQEEKRHAAIIKAGKDILYEFPKELIPTTLGELAKTSNQLTSLLNRYDSTPPSRVAAYRVAIQLEKSAGEVHFQRAMDGTPRSGTIAVFQELNNGDRDHARRIRERMKKIFH